MHKKGIITCSAFGVLALGALCSGASFAAQTCTADEQTGQVTCTNSATASVTVTSSCTFSRGSGDSGEYSGILANNASVEVIGSTFTTTCNDPGGYDIYAVGYSNNSFGVTDLIFNNLPSDSNKIATASSPASTDSYWQMKLTTGTTTTPNPPTVVGGNDTYIAIPSTYTKVASYGTTTVNQAGDAVVGQPITVTYKAHASATQPAGTYTGAVKYTMIHPVATSTPYFVVFDPNGGSASNNATMDDQVMFVDETTTLTANIYTKQGYTFSGWNTKADGTGTTYADGASVTNLTTTAGGEVTLYAIWTAAE